MPENSKAHGVYRFAVATSCCTILLLITGALVTSNNAGDSVPDWPLAYGRLIPPVIGGIRFEYTHRVLAATISILTLILAIWLAATESRRLARRLGWTALALVLAQAALGGVRVLVGYPALSATAHAILAQIFFSTLVGLSLYLSPWWQREHAPLEDSGELPLRKLACWTSAAIFVQLILGAGFRYGAFGVMPHMTGAGVVLILVTLTSRAVRKRFGAIRDLRRWGIFLQAFVGIQFLLGIADYWVIVSRRDAVQPSMLYVCVSVSHVLVGALLLASSIILTLSCFRLIRPSVMESVAKAGTGQSHRDGSPERARI